MAKFCANCGAPMEDDDRVCGQCGTPVEGMAVAETGSAPVKMQAAAKKMVNRNTGMIKGVIAAAVAVVVVAGGVKVAGNNIGYKGTLNRMVKALQKEDTAALEGLASSISDEVCANLYSDPYDYYDGLISDVLDKYEDRVGNLKKVTYEITDSKELSDRRLDNIKDMLVDGLNMDTSEIKKAVEVECKITVKGTQKSASFNYVDLYMVKEKDGWKIVYAPIVSRYMN